MNQRKMGAILSYASMGINIVVQFAYVPLLFYYLSKAEYGLYQLIGSLISYMSIMDFGLSTAIVRYYSRYSTIEDEKSKENILAIFLVIYIGISLLISVVGVALYFNLERIYGKTLSLGELHSAKVMFLILLLNIIVTIPSNIFTAVISASERFIFLKSMAILQVLLKPVVVITVFMFAANAIYLVVIDTMFNFCVILCNVWYCFKKLNLKIKYYFWDSILIKEVTWFSLFVFLGAVMDQIYWRTSQLILGAYIGTAAVAVYAIAVQLDMAYMNFSTGISGVFLPKLSAMIARSTSIAEVDSLFMRIGRIQFLIMAFILSAFALYGKEFILLWVGDGFEESYYIALILMSALLIPLIQNLGIAILQSMNKHAFRSQVYVVIALLNFAFCIPAAKYFGGLGCAVVTAVALFIGQGIIINIYYHYVIGLNIYAFFIQMLRMSLPVLFLLIVGYVLERILPNGGLYIFLCKTIFFTLAYISAMWTFAMDSYEKQLMKGLFRR